MHPGGPGMDDEEVVVDTGAKHAKPLPLEREITRRRNDIFVGVHMPLESKTKGHSTKQKKGSETVGRDPKPTTTPNGLGPTHQALYDGETAAQRVKFLLGEEGERLGGESHDLFSELEELFYDEEGKLLEWKETARWVKYEEDVDYGAGRWSKPHVATLSLHSLFELKRLLHGGTVLLDMNADNLWTISDLVIDNMIATGQLEDENRPYVKEALIRKHRHHLQKRSKEEKQMEKQAGRGRRRSSLYPGIDRSQSTGGNQNISMEQAATSEGLLSKKHSSASNLEKMRRNNSQGSIGRLETSDSLEQIQKDSKFLKKIPPGAEASNILVGEVDFLTKPIVAFVRLANGVVLPDMTEVPIPSRFLFLLLGPPTGDTVKYREIGRCMATLFSDEVFHDVAYRARDRNDLLAGIDEFMDQVTVLPPGSWDPSIRIEPPKSTPSQEKRRQSEHFVHPIPLSIHLEDDAKFELERTGRLFGGLINDVKTKLPFYVSDFTDALNIQCVASFIFMYIACITPIITFGGLLGGATNDYIAAFESLIGGAICGVIYHLFSGQPLTIIGSTGPILIFETIMFQLCTSLGLNYLSFRVWIGFWTCIICIILVATDFSAYVRYITRFTEEAFAALIAFIFIVEAIENLIEISHEYPLQTHPGSHHVIMNDTDSDCMCIPPNDTSFDLLASDWADVPMEDCESLNGTIVGDSCDHHHPVPDVFLFCVILFCGTFVLSYALKTFKFTTFFPTRIRYLISNFGVFFAFISMTLFDILVGLPTPKLTVPNQFQPTRDDRGWIVPLFVNPWWTYFAAIIPALLCGILIFMDQQITAVIVNRRENKLKKGFGYHLDLFVVGLLLFLMSILGMPWFVAATVLSINHVDSLRVMSKTVIPGEPPKVEGCLEQRVTGLLVFIMMGVSSLMTGILRFIPMPVLYGVFLYMGISSLRGVQFVDRLLLYLMPAKHQPDHIYLRHVKLWKVHLFTAIQAICLAILWIIKTSKGAIVFPIMVLAIVIVRKGLDYIFTQAELSFLDDVIPESQKTQKENEDKKMKEEIEEETRARSGTLTVALESGQMLSIPAGRVTFSLAGRDQEEEAILREPGMGTAQALRNLSGSSQPRSRLRAPSNLSAGGEDKGHDTHIDIPPEKGGYGTPDHHELDTRF
ncbi:electroneutral sodium bicarbonate exchanger 1-like [Acanthaster planci]|uniref:Anion exchange protein n=1 Tax=Acanthaster planci TaxID=133434 RepID=A0A8B8A2C9_ACAPL|nr:electroneutral sodium bicarbonate exchanger 1-like [Acanthaster planci]